MASHEQATGHSQHIITQRQPGRPRATRRITAVI
jgi:hypothetical protein